jgi:hypothetical protein
LILPDRLSLVNPISEVSLLLLTNYRDDNFFRDELIFSTAGKNYCAISHLERICA